MPSSSQSKNGSIDIHLSNSTKRGQQPPDEVKNPLRSSVARKPRRLKPLLGHHHAMVEYARTSYPSRWKASKPCPDETRALAPVARSQSHANQATATRFIRPGLRCSLCFRDLQRQQQVLSPN